MSKRFHTSAACCLVLLATLAAGGCGDHSPGMSGGNQPTTSAKSTAKTDPHDDDGHDHGGHDHSASPGDTTHSGWWCDEHGIPEAVCSMCSPKVSAQFQKKGDWCEDHDRAKSQCFVCDSSLKEKFAKQYRAKYGKEPPAISEE